MDPGAVGTALANLISSSINVGDIITLAVPVVGALGALAVVLTVGPNWAFNQLGKILDAIR
ncbi:hypothetical protein [Kallotenue papyrolyticum]|uniref:hypothetical protein n=1 Tax=Kallotenue papyrolyticum TaxID=1325125 RepID=UPI0004927BBE|nr:hypothetical protein [Kallotenue papyrolyticum]